MTEQEAISTLNKALDGRIVKGGDNFGKGYSGAAEVNK